MRLSLSAIDFADALFVSDRGHDISGARQIFIPRLAGREAYSRFVIKDLLEHVRTSHVLLIQWDGYVIHPGAWDSDFLKYDYIGARWGHFSDGYDVGNGGFSLRSRKLLEALQDTEIDQFEPEDVHICREYRPLLESRYGIRFAPAEVADRFSFETTYPKSRTFGFHGLFNMWCCLSDDDVPDFVGAMPRSILGSIQALSLARNFIELRRTESARILLESRLAAFPADHRAEAMLATLRKPVGTARTQVGRNEPCPCGSGKRFKHCCGLAGDATPSSADPHQSPIDGASALIRQAMADHQAGRLSLARQGYLAALKLGPEAMAEHYLGVLDMQEGRPEEAEGRIRTSLAMRHDMPDFHNNLGLCLRAQGRLEEAVVHYRRALDLNPSYAPAWSNIGLDLHKLGRLDEALDAFNHALALEPNLAQTRFSRALALLARGDYLQGWKEYEWRAKCPEYASAYRLPPIAGNPPIWQGEPLAGKKLLLTAEQGIGDTFQFIRYARHLASLGATVSLFLRKAHVVEFLRSAPGLANIYSDKDSEPIPSHDYLAPLLSLPRLCGTRALSDIPAQLPYLSAPADLRHFWRTKLGKLPEKTKIGLSWAGSPGNPDDRNRSCPLDVLAPLFGMKDIAWVSLQLGPGREQIRSLAAPIHDWGDEQTSYAETAALMAELDLILTVDTSLAHAAGAMGLPVWIMLSHVPDFRWLLDRKDSPWYPTARLFRQDKPGDWRAVVDAVHTALLLGDVGQGAVK